LIHVFKEEQVAIENGILSALNRLNQFEDAVEKRLSPESAGQETTEGAGWPAGDSKEEAAVTNGEPESSPQDDAE
jgi:hypothetical protein